MSEEFTLDWSKPKTIDDETFPKDTLGRERYAQFLTQFLVGQANGPTQKDGENKRNYVLNLNSEWGSGKTYFLKRWSEDLKPYFPVVYIDAWQQDYSDDPLMTVISSVIKQLREQAGVKEGDNVIKVSNKIIGLLKAAAPGFARSVAKRYFDIDPVAVMQAEDGDELGKVKGADGEPMDMSAMASSMVKHLIDEHDAKSVAINDLKGNIKQWIKIVTKRKKLQYPAFIFIDELDRCRPSYAVEMLETIKHIFDIEGIVFVVATDTEQLQHAVKAIYGEGFDARLYLGRFFNSRFSLKAPDLKSFLEVHVDHTKLSGKFLEEKGINILPPNPDGKATLRNISVILDAFKMPPRTAIQIADRVIATLSNMPKNSKIDILMLTTLLCFYEEDSEQFLRIVSESFEEKVEEKLTTYLNKRFDKYQSNILVEINFKQFGGSLYYFDNKVFQTSFTSYLTEIFSSHFDMNEPVSFLDLQFEDRSPIKQSFHNFMESLEDLSSDSDIAINYFKHLYDMEKYTDITPFQYQDYVELASALDWIDGNSDNI
ncbi:KAP family P-loop NTPase fold protein [Marinomonas epiphytica]